MPLNRTQATQPPKKKLSFTNDLPTEIRLQVYQHLFSVPNQFFELRLPALITPTFMNSYPLLAAQMGGLRMMSVCREIRGEVAEYFYGANNFRFSQEYGFAVMLCFFYTIRSVNCSFLRNITVQLPNRRLYPGITGGLSNGRWHGLCGALSGHGMKTIHRIFQSPHKVEPGRLWAETCYDQAVRKAFSRLRRMPCLKRLEIIIPTDGFFLAIDMGDGTNPRCACPGVEDMGRDDRIRHLVRKHSGDSKYWDLLARLKKETVSTDLTVALVILYPKIYEFSTPCLAQIQRPRDREFRKREGRLIVAYAALMGYEFGHATWETDGQGYETYKVRYDEDPALYGPPQLNSG